MAIDSNKITLPLIIGIPLLGLVLTTLFYFFVTSYGISLGTQNEGVLVTPPKQMSELQALDRQGQPYRWNDHQGHWTFVVAGTADCDAACQEKLFFVRQTHKALGKGAPRVRTVYLSLGSAVSPETADLLAREYDRFEVVTVAGDNAGAWFSKQPPALDVQHVVRFFVVDPAGWMMMYYTDVHDYKSIIKDMKFLLKNS